MSIFQKEFSLRCEPINYRVDPSSQKLIFVGYLYFVSKILDLFDTVINNCQDWLKYIIIFICITFSFHQIFFVLRKKNNQITFLHIYHHSGMVAATYVYNKFLSGKCFYLYLPILNKSYAASLEWFIISLEILCGCHS